MTNCRLFFFVEKVFLVFLLCHFFFFLAIFWHFYRFYGRGAVVQKAVQNTHPRKKGPESFPAILLASVFFAHPFPRKKFQKKRVCTLCTISYDTILLYHYYLRFLRYQRKQPMESLESLQGLFFGGGCFVLHCFFAFCTTAPLPCHFF